jgi:antitoxin HicB
MLPFCYKVEKEGDDRYRLVFREIGAQEMPIHLTEEKAEEQALNDLIVVLDRKMHGRDNVPIGMRACPGYTDGKVHLPALVQMKIAIRNKMLDDKITGVELAKRIGAKQQTLTRLLDLQHSTVAGALEQALAAVGLRAVVMISDL